MGKNLNLIYIFIFNLIVASLVPAVAYLILWFAISKKETVENTWPIFSAVSIAITLVIIHYSKRKGLIKVKG